MISQDDFCALQKLLLERSGMALGSDKLYLVAGRLGPVAIKHGFRGVLELMANLRANPTRAVVDAVVEAMATHESLFFRDQAPFEHIARAILPDLLRKRADVKTLRIWSAACSTGQEAYSLAMLMREAAPANPGWRFEIIATDFVPAVLDKARSGTYSKFEVDRGISKERLSRHFEPVEDKWRVRPELRALVHFRQHNLLEPAAILGAFDLVLCRNVLIYFDAPTKQRVVGAVLKQLIGGGYAIFGAADVAVAGTPGLRAIPGLPGGFAFDGAPLARVG